MKLFWIQGIPQQPASKMASPIGETTPVAYPTKAEKEVLKNALEPMGELEDLIKNKFQLTQFS